MSDKVIEEFKPIDIASLENFDDERTGRDKKEGPDWERFKVFFEELKKEENEQKKKDPFKALFEDNGEENKEEIVFEQLGGGPSDEAEPGTEKVPEKDGLSSDDLSGVEGDLYEKKQDEKAADISTDKDESALGIVEADAEKKDDDNYDHGYEKGFENGKQEGYEAGLEQGKKDGHEQGMKQGYSEGYAKGEEAAEKDIQAAISKKSEEFDTVLLKLDNTYGELASRYEEKIISLICQISEKVVLAKVEVDDEIAKNAVIEALWALPEPEDVTLSVSEDDYEYIEMVKEDLFDSIKSLKTVFVKSDPSVKRGGCRIETKNGYVEADIESKLEKVFASIKGINKS